MDRAQLYKLTELIVAEVVRRIAQEERLYQYSKTEILPVMTGRIFLSGLIRE